MFRYMGSALSPRCPDRSSAPASYGLSVTTASLRATSLPERYGSSDFPAARLSRSAEISFNCRRETLSESWTCLHRWGRSASRSLHDFNSGSQISLNQWFPIVADCQIMLRLNILICPIMAILFLAFHTSLQ